MYRMKQYSRSKKTTTCKKTPRRRQYAGGEDGKALRQLLEMLTPGQQVLFTGVAIVKRFSDSLFIVYFDDTQQICNIEDASTLLTNKLKVWNTKSIKLSYLTKDSELIEVDVTTPMNVVYTRVAKKKEGPIDRNAPDNVYFYTHPNNYHYDHAPLSTYEYELSTPDYTTLSSFSSFSELDKLLVSVCNHP